MSDSSTTLVPKRIFIAAAEREQMEKRITSWMIEKGWIEPEISDCVLSEGGGRRITRKGNTHISGCEPDRGLAVNGFCVEQFDGKKAILLFPVPAAEKALTSGIMCWSRPGGSVRSVLLSGIFPT